MLLSFANTGFGLNINPIFNYEDNVPYITDHGDMTLSLIVHFMVAANYWERAILDEHDITIRYWFTDEPISPTTQGFVCDEAGRVVKADIKIPIARYYYFDPDPWNSVDFTMEPKLYRNTHPVEQAEAFTGNPPENLEVSFNGIGPSSDLLSIILHEMGHAIGLNPACQDCDTGNATVYQIQPNLLGGRNMGIVDYTYISRGATNYDCAHLALGGIHACADDPECEAHQALMWTGFLPGRRTIPSIVDIMAVAEAGNFSVLDLPRKYPLGHGLWHTASNWIGGRVPHSGDDVYILNQPSTQLFILNDVEVGFIHLWGGNSLVLMNHTLEGGTIDIRMGAIYREQGASSHTNLSSAQIANGGTMNLTGAANIDEIQNFGTLIGDQYALLDVQSFNNSGEIVTSNGVFYINIQNSADFFKYSSDFTAMDGDLVISDFSDFHNAFQGQLDIGPDHYFSMNRDWTLDWRGRIYLHGKFDESDLEFDLSSGSGKDKKNIPLANHFDKIPRPGILRGNLISFGDIHVEDVGRIEGEVIFKPYSSVMIPDPDGLLILQERTIFQGGQFTGAGTLSQEGNAIVKGNTIIEISKYNWDGQDLNPSTTLIYPGFRFDLQVDQFDQRGETNKYDGTTIMMDSELNVVVAAEEGWRMDGDIQLNFPLEMHEISEETEIGFESGLNDDDSGRLVPAGFFDPARSVISGSPINITGNLHVRDEGLFEAPFRLSGLILIYESASLILSSDLEYELEEGRILGLGEIQVPENTILSGNGIIGVGMNIRGTVRTEETSLVLNGEINLEGGHLVSDGPEARLEINSSWSTGFGTLELRRGYVIGGNILNEGQTIGLGILEVESFTNNGILSPGYDFDENTRFGGLRFQRDFTQTNTGVLQLEIGNDGNEDLSNDLIHIDRFANLAGELEITVHPEYSPREGDQFIILTSFGGISGNFDNYSGLDLGGGLHFEYLQDANTLRLVVVAD